MGHVSAGLPQPQLPLLDLPTLQSGMLLDSLVLAVVCFAIAFSMGKIYAKKYEYSMQANQELVAQGAANSFASLFSCFPATASLSRTAVMGQYAVSHLSSLVSCFLLLLVLLFFAPALAYLPKAVVAVIIIVSQKSLVFQVCDFKHIWRSSRWEGVSQTHFLSLSLLLFLIKRDEGVFPLTLMMRLFTRRWCGSSHLSLSSCWGSTMDWWLGLSSQSS